MSRWLGQNIAFMPLGKIEDEIAAIEKLPMHTRTVIDTERLRDLYTARRRITGGKRDICRYHLS